MATNNRPTHHLLAVIDPPERDGRTVFKRMGALWEGEKPGTFTGTVDALPSEWMGGGVAWRISIQPAERGDDSRGGSRRGR